jgi:hypothetical protein
MCVRSQATLTAPKRSSSEIRVFDNEQSKTEHVEHERQGNRTKDLHVGFCQKHTRMRVCEAGKPIDFRA